MPEYTYITVKEYEEMKKFAEEYGLPIPSPMQPMRLKEEKKDETKKEGR